MLPRRRGPDSARPADVRGWLAEDPGSGDLGAVWAWARTGARACGLDPTPVDDLADGSTPLRRERRATSVPVQA